jgi:hypothetical protein
VGANQRKERVLFRSWKSRAAVFAVAATLAVPVLGSPAGAAKGGNSANAHACQKGGWQSLQTDTGGAFASQDACVSYGARGGQIFAPTMTLTPSTVSDSSSSYDVLGTGFHPNIAVAFVATSPLGDQVTVPGTTDSAGTVSYHFVLGCPSPHGLLDGDVITETITDDAGVHATALLTVLHGCP